MNIALIGPSGVGKGTHAASLCGRFALSHVATGDLFRHNLKIGSALGLLARKYMEHGELVPDEVVDAMIEEWCHHRAPGVGALFDGFPRTAYQARFLDGLLQKLNRPLDAVIYLHVPDAVITERLAGRLICRTCQAPYHRTLHPARRDGVCDVCDGDLYQRPDDSTELVQARLRVFHRMTGPVFEHYAATGRLAIISGEGSVGEVDTRLLDFIETVKHGLAKFATAGEAAALAGAGRDTRLPAPTTRSSLDLVLLGGPGSGKGTQAERLCAALSLPHISTGDLFRENLQRGTDLGQLAKIYMERGELVPDDVTEAMVEERLERPDTRTGFILDGFPRTLPQAGALRDMLDRQQRRIAGVLYIKVSDAALTGRLSGRLICQACQAPYHLQFKPSQRSGICDVCGGELYQRADDNPATVRARLTTFHGQTGPLIDSYRQAGLLLEIDGEGPLAEVGARCLAALRNLTPSPEFSASVTAT
jgi:adenylate kinase